MRFCLPSFQGNLPWTTQDSAAFLQAKFEENLSENVQMRTLARKGMFIWYHPLREQVVI